MQLDKEKLQKVEETIEGMQDIVAGDCARAIIVQLQKTTVPGPDGSQCPHLSLARQGLMELDYLGYGGTELRRMLTDLEEDVSRVCDPICIKAQQQWDK
jgi:hypothetical protein